MGRPKSVYRGKRKYRWIITLTAFVVIALVAAAVGVFTYMQKYIVYDKDGLSLRLPLLQQQELSPLEDLAEEEAQLVFTPLENVEIVVDEPDHSQLMLANTELAALQGRYVAAESVSAESLNYYAYELGRSGQSAMVIQLKTADGYFSYKSQVPLADSYGVNGSADIRAAVLEMKAKDIYLVAEISCLLDDAMAQRNVPLALKNSAGGVLTDGSGSWLDPRNRGVRDYLTALLEEVAAMGFDEVLLSGVAHPKAAQIHYSQVMTAAPSLGGSVATFAVFMSETARELGLNCSVLCDASHVRLGTGGDVGQDYELFGRIFDRLYLKTSRDFAASDISALACAAESRRVVPIVMGTAPETESFALQ